MRTFCIQKFRSFTILVLIISFIFGSTPSFILAESQNIFILEEASVVEEAAEPIPASPDASAVPAEVEENDAESSAEPEVEIAPIEEEVGEVALTPIEDAVENEAIDPSEESVAEEVEDAGVNAVDDGVLETPATNSSAESVDGTEAPACMEVFACEDVLQTVAPKNGGATQTLRRPLPSFFDAVKQKEKKTEQSFVAGEVLVRFKNKKIDLTSPAGATALAAFLGTHGLELKSTINASNIAVVRVPEGEEATTIARLKYQPEVLHVQLNFRYEPRSNDTRFSSLWALENTGQLVEGLESVTGTADADIDAAPDEEIDGAWAKNEGDGVIVAVIDSGVAFNHPDLLANMWDGTNCVDENDVSIAGGCEHGYDFDDNDPRPLPVESSHGTHIAGTIAAVGNNGIGIIGVAPQAKIMALRAQLTVAGIISAINFAGANGARVINASWGLYGDDSPFNDLMLKKAIDDFPGIFVAAAGNEGFDHDDGNPAHVSYPDGFDLPNILVVAATNQNDGLWSFSDYGAESVDVGAPGTNILSTGFTQETFSGATLPDFSGTKFTKTSGSWFTSTWDGNDKNAMANASYVNNDDGMLTLTSPLDTTVTDNDVTLEFYLQIDTEPPLDGGCFDYLSVEVDNNDDNWDRVYLRCGDILGTQTVNLGPGTENMRIRFVWHTDGSLVGTQVPIIDDVSISNTHDYEYMQGTSMAAPHVAGVAALIKSFNPNVTYAQAKQIIMETGDDLSDADKAKIAEGKGKRVNAANVLAVFAPHVGFSEDDVIPASVLNTQGILGDGQAAVKIPFRIRDEVAELPVTLEQFEYSTDDGETWQAPANGDASGAVGASQSSAVDWRDNDYTTALEYPDTDDDAFTLIWYIQHGDLTGLDGVEQDDVRARFKANDGAVTSPFAVSEAFSVDLLVPIAALSGTPDALTNATGATITVGGDDVVLYRYALDDDEFTENSSPVAEPIALSGLTEGQHILRVVAIDDAGNEQEAEDATTFTWTVDTTPGTALLTSKPDARTNQTSATIVIGGEDVATYTYLLDDEEPQGPFPISDAIELLGLSEGQHVIAVKGIDEAGNIQESPTLYTWVIDITSATPTLAGIPPDLTNLTSASIEVGGTEVIAYRFALDGGAFGPETTVATPITLTDLADGTHTVAVIGRDDVGNWQEEEDAVTASWTVDTVAPSLAEKTPVATPTNNPTPTVVITIESGANWEILRGEIVLAVGTGTGADQSIQLPTLTDGIYELTLTAEDVAGNSASITLEPFVIDTASPTGLSLDGIPTSPTNITAATITLNAGADVVLYRVSIDGGVFGPETPIATPITLTDLADGTHTIAVIARDEAGNWMPEDGAISATWIVDTVPPVVVFGNLPQSPTPSSKVVITIETEDVVQYRVSFNGGAFGTETSVDTPITVTELADGAYTIAAIGRDAAGNWQSEDAATTFAWVKDASLAVAPSANPADISFSDTLQVTFTAPGADVIRYSTNGEPQPNCAEEEPVGKTIVPGDTVSFRDTTTVHAIACYGATPSSVASFVYTILRGGGGGGIGVALPSLRGLVPQTQIPASPVAPTVDTGTRTVAPQVLGVRVFSEDVLIRVDEYAIYVVRGRTLHRIPDLQALQRFTDRVRIEVAAADTVGYETGRPLSMKLPARTERTLLRVDGKTIYVVNGANLNRVPDVRSLWPYRDYTRLEVGEDELIEFKIGDPMPVL